MEAEKHFSELEIENLEDIYRDFVAKSSLFALLAIIILFLISPNFFDRLQYEDGYIENLTAVSYTHLTLPTICSV